MIKDFYMPKFYQGVFCGLIMFLFLLSCSNTLVENVDRNNSYKYQPGHPELRVVTSSFIDQSDSTFLNIASEVIYRSLSFKKRENVFVAKGSIDIEIEDIEDEYDRRKVYQFPVEIKDQDFDLVRSQESYFFQSRFNIEPGKYLVTVTYTDQETLKSTSRVDEINVPDPQVKTSNTNVPDIRVLVKESRQSEFKPVTTYDIPNNIDSVKFVFQVTSTNLNKPLIVRSRLVKFESDTTEARLMHYNDYSTGSLSYKGIDYGEREIISSSRRALTNTGTVLIEFVFGQLNRGNYRIEIYSEEEDGFYKAHDFGIKSPNYPTLKTPRELAAPLVYLMRKKDHEALMNIQDEDSMKKEIDRFWLTNVKNKNLARSTLELYYSRVEEANKQFSNFKEGWKTDYGMIYIFFGSPWNVEYYLDEVRWGYSYNSNDQEKNFYFTRTKIKNDYFPFDNYVLMRSNFYYNIQYERIQLWLNGTILKSNI
jgi:GWxTD domain-containing protein